MNTLRALAVPFALLSIGAASAQSAARVDFDSDVQPIFRQNCVSCHGPAKQNGGMRLDRRSSAMKVLARRIIPGSSENSFVYHRVSSTVYGPSMPPTGDLKPAEIKTIKDWIDQGAVWPDALANDVELPPIDPAAVHLIDLLHRNELSLVLRTVSANPALLNARGPGGATPFMYALVYANTPTIARLLSLGADPNAHTDGNASALLWAARDLPKVRLLVQHGAKVNAKSDDFRTPLMSAARRPGNLPGVQFLLDHGAEVNPNPHPMGQSSPLLEALTAGDAAIVRVLLAHGANAPAIGEYALALAVQYNCTECLKLLVPKIDDKDIYTAALQDAAVFGDLASTRLFLEHGADPKRIDPLGRTALMYAAASDILPLEQVKLLVAHGSDVKAIDQHTNSGDAGLSVLDIAQRHGPNPVAEFLRASGATLTPGLPVDLHPRQKNDIRSAIQDSIPHLQTADVNFSSKTGCISCHNNSATAMTLSGARKQGFRIDEKVATAQVAVNVDFLAKNRELLYQGFMIPTLDNFSESIVGYQLVGMAAEGYKPDLNTDAAALHLLMRQQPDGQWYAPTSDIRQPLCLGHIEDTALSMRALQLYAPKANAAAYRRSVQLAATWLASATSYNNDDMGWRVAGLAWADTNGLALRTAKQQLAGAQKPNGGWSDLPSMEATAYATGKSLVALHLAGMPASDPVYKRGVQWLLDNQQQDGTWYVQTRALAFQPAFDAGFPYGHNQWISAAGTNWAAQALTFALPESRSLSARVEQPLR